MATRSWSNNTATVYTVPEITPLELVRKLESGELIQIVDVRARVGGTAVPGSIPEDKIHNIVGSRLLKSTRLEDTGMKPGTQVIVICAHGNDSKTAAQHLNRLGAQAWSLTGGVAAWMKLSVPRKLLPPSALDQLVQFDRVGKEALSYALISNGKAMLIDPPRNFAAHLQFLVEEGATLIAVADTHVHADYISGGLDISRRLGVPYYLHPADSIYPYDSTPGHLEFTPVSDGMTIQFGRCVITADHTPGHSPGSVTYRVGSEAAFTGDFLFISSVGRPDLADKTDEWASQLWRSIQRAKSSWTSAMMVYPAHYTSQTPRGDDGTIADSFSHLLANNPALKEMTEAEFLRWIKAHEAVVPAEYRTIKGINVGLFTAGEDEADMLENGKNECAVL